MKGQHNYHGLSWILYLKLQSSRNPRRFTVPEDWKTNLATICYWFDPHYSCAYLLPITSHEKNSFDGITPASWAQVRKYPPVTIVTFTRTITKAFYVFIAVCLNVFLRHCGGAENSAMNEMQSNSTPMVKGSGHKW